MNPFPEFPRDNFKNIKIIGEGGYGKVFLIENKEDHQQYAAKLLKNADNSFSKEIESYSKVNNKAILTIYGYTLEDFNGSKQPMIITEYLPNGSLSKMIEMERYALARSDFTSTKKYIILMGIALGMKFLHYRGIVHRDLKPDNILLDNDLYPKICDFGCSSTSNIKDIVDFILTSEERTPAYMAPEIFSDGFSSPNIDVYAFSILAYELITGKPPFIGYRTPFNLIDDVINGKRPDTSGLNEIIRLFLEKCWSQNPDDRPTFGQIITEMNKPEFKDAFGILDEQQIEIYLDLFDDDLKDPVLMDFNSIKTDKSAIESFRCNFSDKKGHFLYGTEKMKMFRHLMKSEIPEMKESIASFFVQNGDKKEQKKYAKVLKKLAEEGDVWGMCSYADALRFGHGFKIDYKTAAMYYKKAADKDNRYAMRSYAEMLHEGIGIKVNKKEAAKYIKMAAERGQLEAIVNYAGCLESGDGVEVNKEEAIKYYTIAASKGVPEAMFRLGVMHLMGEIKSEDKTLGYHLIERSAVFGCKEGMYATGLMLRDGKVVVKDLHEAAKFIRMSAEKGYPIAMKELGGMLYYGQGVEQNKLEAAKFLKMAADNGIDECILSYASMQFNGDGVLINKQEANKYFKLAADKGNPNGMYIYGMNLLNGNGIEKNIKEAMKYIKMAADRGNNYAKQNYDVLNTLYGSSIKMSKNEFAQFCKKAADNGNDLMALKFGQILYLGDGIKMNKKEGLKYLRKSADQGNENAMVLYGIWSIVEDGSENNRNEAIRFFQMSAKKGNIYAIIMTKYVFNETK